MTQPAVYNAGVGYPVNQEIDGNLTIKDPYATGQYGILTARQIAASVAGGLAPTADQSGARDTAAILTAQGSGPVQLGAGDFYINPAQLSWAPGQAPRGLGPGLTRIFVVGGTAGQAGLTFRNPAFPTSGDPFAKTNLSLPAGGFFLDGSLAVSGVNGIEIGDIYLLDLTDFEVANFTGGFGLYFVNRIGWTERAHVRGFIDHCGAGVVFDVQGGTNSFAYSDVKVSLHQNPNQTGLSWRNGAIVYGGTHVFTGNFQTSSVAQTGVAIDFGTDNTSVQWKNDVGAVIFETNGGLAFPHQSVNLGTGADLEIDKLIFRGTWAAGNLAFSKLNQTAFRTQLLEPTLGSAIPTLMKHANVTALPSATANTYGPPATISPDGKWNALTVAGFSWTPNGVSGENITLQVTVTFADASTTIFTMPTVAGNVANQPMNLQQLLTCFYKPTNAIASFQVQTQSSISSSTATPQFNVAGENRP